MNNTFPLNGLLVHLIVDGFSLTIVRECFVFLIGCLTEVSDLYFDECF